MDQDKTCCATSFEIPAVPYTEVHTRLGLDQALALSEASVETPLHRWRMEYDDLIIRSLFRQFQPKRHLEFGTWEGLGVLRCLEECDATVWTINLLEGEAKPDGRWAYNATFRSVDTLPLGQTTQLSGGRIVCRTDAFGFIGRHYLERQMGHRVCQIYCDSRAWDVSNYPQGFFDTVMIDGGHAADVVISDTRKALELVRAGGLILWHDFCPDPEVQAACASTRGVATAIHSQQDRIMGQVSDLFWVNPSWILVGVRR